MRIKKKNIGENLKNTEDELNAIKGMVNQTSDELRNMGMDDKESKEIAVNVVTKSYVDSKNDEIVSEVVDGIDEASDEHAVSVDATHDMGIIQNIIRSVDNLSQIPVLKNLVDNFKVKHNSEPELGTLVDTLNNQINSIMRQSESEDGDASRAIQYGQQQGEVGDSEYDEYQTLLRSLAADSKEIENGDDEEPMNDLPFESVKPKMTKNELIESVLNNTSKKRKVIKTISVKNLRNE